MVLTWSFHPRRRYSASSFARTALRSGLSLFTNERSAAGGLLSKSLERSAVESAVSSRSTSSENSSSLASFNFLNTLPFALRVAASIASGAPHQRVLSPDSSMMTSSQVVSPAAGHATTHSRCARVFAITTRLGSGSASDAR